MRIVEHKLKTVEYKAGKKKRFFFVFNIKNVTVTVKHFPPCALCSPILELPSRLREHKRKTQREHFHFLSVTGISLWGALISTGVVCTFYCTLVSFNHIKRASIALVY